MSKRPSSISQRFEGFAEGVTQWTGTTGAFGLALGSTVVWFALGPAFRFSDTWQLGINTATTVITFLMVFLVQRTQNKQSLAMQLKLNELVAAMKGASNRLIEIETLSEKDLLILNRHYAELAALARKTADITESHSVEEARERHSLKHRSS